MRPTKSAVRAIGLRSAVTVPTGTASGPLCCATPDAASPHVSNAAPAKARIAGRRHRMSRRENRDRRGRRFSNSIVIMFIGQRNPAADAGCVDAAMTGIRSNHDVNSHPAQIRVEQLDCRRDRYRPWARIPLQDDPVPIEYIKEFLLTIDMPYRVFTRSSQTSPHVAAASRIGGALRHR